jgi:hypothetical protein
MKREKEIPAQPSQKPLRLEAGANDQSPFVHGRHNLEFQPCLSRYLHLSPKQKALLPVHREEKPVSGHLLRQFQHQANAVHEL